MATNIGVGPASVVAANHQAGSAPTTNTSGFLSMARRGRVRTFFDYAGSVTACNVRLYTRDRNAGSWYRGASTNESGFPLAPTSGNETRDWDVGNDVEFTFVVESISPGTSGNTVAIKAAGVSR